MLGHFFYLHKFVVVLLRRVWTSVIDQKSNLRFVNHGHHMSINLKDTFSIRFWGRLLTHWWGRSTNNCFSGTRSPVNLKFGALHVYCLTTVLLIITALLQNHPANQLSACSSHNYHWAILTILSIMFLLCQHKNFLFRNSSLFPFLKCLLTKVHFYGWKLVVIKWLRASLQLACSG